MGEVYRADDLTLGQAVALKFLPAELAADGARLARFHNEVRTARQVSHPNVCRIHDIGQFDGQHFLSMEYVDGEDLASLLRRIGRLPGDKGVEIARQICAGLAAAHEKGVLHRDLKPANIMLDGRGKVRIADFGLAQAAGELRDPNTLEGTPAYMAPEQFAGQAESVRSDIYSLGLVLYEMLTGKPAFKAATVAQLSRMHLESNPTAPSALLAAFDPAVERVILRCLEKDPEARPRSALAVAAALPGGDPLAAALAAGETPSPEMVAAAGETGGLAPKAAWACLATIAACLVAAVALSSATSLFSFVALPKTPDALCERGREIIRRLGYTADPKDSARGFALSDYIVYLSEHDRSPGRWEKLRAGEPPAALFWYRQSPRALQTTDIWGRVTLNQPPQLISGMITVLLDTEGRLVKFDAVPPQVEERDKAGRQPDWAALFAETGLDFAALRPAPSAWTPPVYADTRAAWEGTYPKQPDIPIRIEAAAAGGKPVYFQIFEPWSRPRRMEEALPSLGVRVANALVIVIVIAVLAAALGLARHNLRLGRGDRKGALRISVSLLLLIGTARHLGASYAPDMNQQLFVFMSILGASLCNAAFIWIGYVALEPHVRRIWPHTIISWSRLLAGQFRDPLVGRDILAGAVVGCAWMLITPLRHLVAVRLGLPPRTPHFGTLDVLQGPRFALGMLLNQQAQSVLFAMYLFLALFLLRLVVRKVWLAGASLVIVNLGLTLAVSTASPAVDAAEILIVSASMLFLLLRFGLLSAIAAIFCSEALDLFPLTADFSAWYAGTSAFPLLVVGALAVYAFHTALAGKPAFRLELLGD
ncbi:MAG: hypothetical protein DMG07_15995 [Acidobacteria bacterium]|nr:MAG: hypothetical protein DMG07_15995 [Acidobacteriota bacterium]